MSTKPLCQDPIRCLVLDGGGLRGCLTLKILKELEDKARTESGNPNIKICDLFDLIIGTSTGGLLALGLGIKKMSIDECDEFYNEVAVKVFNAPSKEAIKDPSKQGYLSSIWSAAKKYSWQTWLWLRPFQTKYNAEAAQYSGEVLKECIKNIFDDQLMCDPNLDICKPRVALTVCQANDPRHSVPMLLRNYSIPCQCEGNIVIKNETSSDGDNTIFSKLIGWLCLFASPILDEMLRIYRLFLTQEDDHNDAIDNTIDNTIDFGIKKKRVWLHGVSNIEIWKAGRATAAAPTYFESVKVKQKDDAKFCGYREIKLVDGGLTANTPALMAWAEATSLWPGSDIFMYSVGTGQAKEDLEALNRVGGNGYLDILLEAAGAIWSSKEAAQIMTMKALDANMKGLSCIRHSPIIRADKTEMSDWRLMRYWRERGTQWAKDKDQQKTIGDIATFLLDLWEKKNNRNENMLAPAA